VRVHTFTNGGGSLSAATISDACVENGSSITSSAFPLDASISPVMISDSIWGAGCTSAAGSAAAEFEAGCCDTVTDDADDAPSGPCEDVRTCAVTADGVGRVSGGTGGSGGGVARSLVVTTAVTSIFATAPAAVSPLPCIAGAVGTAPDTDA